MTPPVRSAAPSGAPIGILGGTFDPIHYGHLRLALECVEALGLASVRLVPAFQPVHRAPPAATAEARARMLGLAIEGEPTLALDTRELERGGPSYMVETLRSFRSDWPRRSLCLLLGVDAFTSLDTWQEWKCLFELVHIGVARRPGATLPEQGPVAEMLRRRRASSARCLRRSPGGRIAIVDIPMLEISSTTIRARLRQGRRVRFLLPDSVLTLIDHEGLYRDAR